MVDRSGSRTVFGYDAANDRTDTWTNANTATPPTTWALHTHSVYDTSLRLTRITDSRASNDATKILDESYCYTSYSSGTCVAAVTTPTTSTDRDQQQGFKDELAGIVTNYAYNPDNRLASATPASGTGPTFSYTYDKAGNRLSKTKTVGGTPSTTYAAFNSDSQLCWTGPTSGTCASPPGGSATNYVYDRDGNQTTSPTNVSTYNGTDQTLTIAHGGGAAGSYGYTNTSQDQRVSAPGINYRNGLLGVQSEIAGGVFSYYERDPAGSLVAMIQGGTEYSYAMDGYGNVRYLVDNTGTVQTGYTYDPYGDNGTESGPNYTLGDNNHYRYRGEYFDYATNQYKIGKRYYDPISGTWTQQDSINILGDPANGNNYSYVSGDPTNQIDPTGAKGRAGEPEKLSTVQNPSFGSWNFQPFHWLFWTAGGRGCVSWGLGGALAGSYFGPIAAGFGFAGGCVGSTLSYYWH